MAKKRPTKKSARSASSPRSAPKTPPTAAIPTPEVSPPLSPPGTPPSPPPPSTGAVAPAEVIPPPRAPLPPPATTPIAPGEIQVLPDVTKQFDSLTKWASDDTYVLSQRTMAVIGSVVARGDVRMRLWLMQAARRKLPIIQRWIEKLDQVGQELLTEEKIKNADLKTLMQLHEMLSSSINAHSNSLHEGMPEISAQQLADIFTPVDEEKSVAEGKHQMLLPEHKEMVRGVLLKLKDIGKAGPVERPTPTAPRHHDNPETSVAEIMAAEVEFTEQRKAELARRQGPTRAIDPGLLGPPPAI